MIINDSRRRYTSARGSPNRVAEREPEEASTLPDHRQSLRQVQVPLPFISQAQIHTPNRHPQMGLIPPLMNPQAIQSVLVEYIVFGHVVAMFWEGKNVVTGRAIIGATNPATSAAGTIHVTLLLTLA
ncbi:hypothetical protein QQ045_017939 [Rhodiola kirilowii]